MNIGILSMQHIKNYGSFLQAFALKKTIENEGHLCEFVDIIPGAIFPDLRRTIPFLLRKGFDRYFHIDILKRLKYTRYFKKRFDQEFHLELGIDKHTISFFDRIVIGSDEVFNFAQRGIPWGYTKQLYGSISNSEKVFSYAGSFGHTKLKHINRYKVGEEIAKSFAYMSAVSVRDQNSFQIVHALTGKPPELHVDPMLMFNFDLYQRIHPLQDCIVIYSYPNRIKKKAEISAIRTFANKKRRKLVSIGFYFPWCDETIIPHPFELLSIIKQAAWIITDTFHGAVMSLKYNRPFVVLVRPSNKQKLLSLLMQMGLADRILSSPEKLDAVLDKSVDYDKTNRIIDRERIRSLNYIRANLEDV